jgi:hypothetical protein
MESFNRLVEALMELSLMAFRRRCADQVYRQTTQPLTRVDAPSPMIAGGTHGDNKHLTCQGLSSLTGPEHAPLMPMAGFQRWPVVRGLRLLSGVLNLVPRKFPPKQKTHALFCSHRDTNQEATSVALPVETPGSSELSKYKYLPRSSFLGKAALHTRQSGTPLVDRNGIATPAIQAIHHGRQTRQQACRAACHP